MVRRIWSAVGLVLGSCLLGGCYTQVKTVPPVPPPARLAVDSVQIGADLDGEYSGTVLVVDETGHHTARIHLALDRGWYRALVEDLPVVEGEYRLRDGEIILMEQASRDSDSGWKMVPSGHFELHRTAAGLTLVQHLSGRGRYREVVLSRLAVQE